MIDFRSLVNRVLKHSTATFGEEVTFYPKSGRVFKKRGVFDNEFQLVDPTTEHLVSVNQPMLGINLNDFPMGTEPKVGDEVRVRVTRFRIVDKREDGQGGASLILQKVTLRERLGDTKDPQA